MNPKQQTAFNVALTGVSFTVQSQIANGIDQVLTGTWSTDGLKACKAWERISDSQRLQLSHLLDKWLFEQGGNAGCITESGVRSYYKPDRLECSPIMPVKFIL